MIEEEEPRGFGERPQSGFSDGLDSRVAFYQFALTIYDYRCAISGLRFDAGAGALHDRLEVVLIHPRELDGTLDLANVLVLETGLADAFRRGLIAVDNDFGVLTVRPQDLSAEQLAMIVPRRKLLLPKDPLFRPSEKNLNFHRFVIAHYPQ